MEHGLKKLQIARQLKNYKDKKYQVLEEGIVMEYTKFVRSMLAKIHYSKRNFGNRDLTHYVAIIGEFPSVALDLVSAFRVGGSISHDILICAVKNWTIVVSEEFPKLIA